jgi:hypothetical protein
MYASAWLVRFRWLVEGTSTSSGFDGRWKLIAFNCLSAASFLAFTFCRLVMASYSSSSSAELGASRGISDVARRSWDLLIGSYVLIGSGFDLFRTRHSREDSGITALADELLVGLLTRPRMSGDVVPGRTSGLEVTSTGGVDRRPRAFKGDETG